MVLVRAVYVLQPLRNDEGGYLLVARQWHAGGEFMYGDYFVDRPPLLMVIFRVAALSDWDGAIRVLAIPFVLVLVLAAWHAGRLLSGPSGARWSASVGAGLACSPALAADQAEGELFGAALVMASIALGLSAWRRTPSPAQLWLAMGAGLLAVAAALVKQSLLEGVLWLACLVLAAAWAGGAGRREFLVTAGALTGGLLLPVLFWLLGMSAGVDPGTVWRDLAGFRGAAFEAIWSDSPRATITRAVQLVGLGVLSGILVVVLTWLLSARRGLRRAAPEQWATTVVLLFGIAAIVAGGSYWPPYLMQLVPGAVLAVGLAAPSPGSAGRWMRVSGRAVVAAAVLAFVVTSVVYASVPWVWFQQRTGEWLAGSKSAGDTVLVTYGHASILEAADMQSPYPHLWSLPMRTLDPDQERLRATIAGPQAPAWVVQVNGFNSWGIDSGARLRDLVQENYRVVAEVCGAPVWLRHGLERDLAPPPRC